MRVVFTEPFKRDYNGLPPKTKRELDKALDFFSKSTPSFATRQKAAQYINLVRAHKPCIPFYFSV